MATESDGIEEAFEGQFRLIMTAASQAAEKLARLREQQMRNAAFEHQQEARQLQTRFEAEQKSARAMVSGVYRPEWWDQAKPEQIAHTYQVASAWADTDRDAQLAQARMKDEIQNRYGLSPEDYQRSIYQRPEPTYTLNGEAGQAAELNRDQAAEVVRGLPVDSKLSPDGQAALNDVQSWINRDYELDKQIHDKFPELFAKDQQAAFDTETHRRTEIFPVQDFTDNAAETRLVDKNGAQSIIDGLPENTQLTPAGRGPLNDVQRWIHLDYDIDKQIHEKFPQVFAEEQAAAFGAESERRQAAVEAEEAAILMRQADEHDREADLAKTAAEHEPDPDDRISSASDAEKHEALAHESRDASKDVYDSMERRENTAATLEKDGVPKEAIDARMAADVSNSKPATEAVKGTKPTAKAPKAKRNHLKQKSKTEMSR